MAQVATITPLNQFFSLNGSPLKNGKLYFGEVSKDPEQFPITVYWDEAGLVPALQPIRTTSGYPSRSGSPAILYVDSLYSMRVSQSNDVQVYYIASTGTPPQATPTPFIDTGLTPSYASANSFTLTGDQTGEFQPGRRARMTLGSGFVYGTIFSSVYGALTTVTMIMDSTSLDASLSAVALSFFAVTPSAVPTALPFLASTPFIKSINDFRLTLTTGVPITTTDVTGATTIYAAPLKGNSIALYDGTSAWNVRQSAQFSIALGTLTSGLPYDLFVYDNAGVPTFRSPVAWTNGTTRDTELTTQDGVLVKPGATTDRYVGTFYTTSTTATEDSVANRFLWNYYNRVDRIQSVIDTTDSWTYLSGTWRQARATATNKFSAVIGWADTMVDIDVNVTASGGSINIFSVGIGIDSTSVNSATLYGTVTADAGRNNLCRAVYRGYPAVGYHDFNWLEVSNSTTATFYGDAGTTYAQSGMVGKFLG